MCASVETIKPSPQHGSIPGWVVAFDSHTAAQRIKREHAIPASFRKR
jgi:hypothetical protein